MGDPLENEASVELQGERRRLWGLAGTVFVLVLALHFTPLKDWLQQAQLLKAQVGEWGWRAEAGFVLGSVVGIALGVPRLALCALGGVLFGFSRGLLLSQFSGVAGAYGAFLLTRHLGPREWVRRKLQGSERLRRMLAKPSVAAIFVARQMPFPGLIPNVLLGVLETRHWTFLVGTFLGYLPSNIPVALAGSSMGKDSLIKAMAQISLSMLALGAFGALVLWIRRRMGSEIQDEMTSGSQSAQTSSWKLPGAES